MDHFNKKYPIDVGPLYSIGSLNFHISERVHDYLLLYLEGKNPPIEWDLSHLISKRINFAALTYFLSICNKLRGLVGSAQCVKSVWNPRILGFLNDIAFFEIAEGQDLFDWPEDMREGFKDNLTNPNTKIILFPHSKHEIPNKADLQDWKNWKDQTRENINSLISAKCINLFATSKNSKQLPTSLRKQVTNTCAELVLNCLLHGNDDAFVGLQRTYDRISVAVCDNGIGFLQSLKHNYGIKLSEHNNRDHLKSILYSCFANEREFGLKKAIKDVLSIPNSYVSIFGYNAQIFWKKKLWEAVVRHHQEDGYTLDTVIDRFESNLIQKALISDYEDGFFRIWKYGLSGVRITFEIKINK